jgi:hypothetical protein
MRERSKVAQGVTRCVKVPCQLPVPDARADHDSRPFSIDCHDLRQTRDGDKISRSVSKAVERMTGAECPHMLAPRHQALKLCQ